MVLAIAGEDFSVIGTDLRLTEGYSIHTRDCARTYELSDNVMLCCYGFHDNVLMLTTNITSRMKM